MRADYNSYIEHKDKCDSARARGEFCLSDWTKEKLVKKLCEAIEYMELEQEYNYLTPIARTLKGKGIKTLEDFKKDINKRYTKNELQNYLLKYTSTYRTGNRLRHTRFYKIKDHKDIMQFICNYYQNPKPTQLKLNLELG